MTTDTLATTLLNDLATQPGVDVSDARTHIEYGEPGVAIIRMLSQSITNASLTIPAAHMDAIRAWGQTCRRNVYRTTADRALRHAGYPGLNPA